MPTEQEKVIAALKYAIDMEKEGKEFYLGACAGSSNELGKKLLESLAQQEDYHHTKFEEIYEKIRKTHSWAAVNFKADAGRTLRTIFASETASTTCEPGNEAEIDILERARHMEGDSYDFYMQRSKEAQSTGEKEFYTTIAEEEHEHQLVLTDYVQYMKNPAGWFVMKERHSIDGG
jgi:rubrerythrin